MTTLERLPELLPGIFSPGDLLDDDLREVRLRADRPAQLKYSRREVMTDGVVSAADLRRALTALMEYSVYAREEELKRGFFTLPDGCRVGVCGQVSMDGGRVASLSGIGAACLRVARAVPGCAAELYPLIEGGGRLHSTLLISRPGMGKTTCLRDLARRISEDGWCVAMADERHELAACVDGVPTLDVGPRTDVMDGAPRHIAVPALIRSMAPDCVAVDEIGDPRDAAILADAARCGISVIATAHAGSLREAMDRSCLRELLTGGIFEYAAVLAEDGSGRVSRVYDLKEVSADAVRAGGLRRRGLRDGRMGGVRRQPPEAFSSSGAGRGTSPSQAAHDRHVRTPAPFAGGGGVSAAGAGGRRNGGRKERGGGLVEAQGAAFERRAGGGIRDRGPAPAGSPV